MNTIRDQVDAESRSDPERLEREIDQQRDLIGNIVSALENKLSPSEIVDRVMRASKGTGGEFARNLGNVVRANPMPTLLASAGLVWLYASRHDPAPVHDPARSDGRGHSSAGAGSASPFHGSEHDGPGEEVRDQASHLREGISEHASHVREGASHLRENASHRLGGAREGFSHLMEENPLVVGAIALGIGALLGAALPVTHKEDELMGETGDKLRSTASAAGQTVRETGREVLQSVREKDSGTARETTDGGESTAGQDYASRSWTSDGSAGASTTRGLSGTTTQGSGNSPRNSI